MVGGSTVNNVWGSSLATLFLSRCRVIENGNWYASLVGECFW
jgi:hypothetical protein